LRSIINGVNISTRSSGVSTTRRSTGVMSEDGDQVAHAQLAFLNQVEDPQPNRVREGLKHQVDQIRA
jgi:hypothetical protein